MHWKVSCSVSPVWYNQISLHEKWMTAFVYIQLFRALFQQLNEWNYDSSESTFYWWEDFPSWGLAGKGTFLFSLWSCIQALKFFQQYWSQFIKISTTNRTKYNLSIPVKVLSLLLLLPTLLTLPFLNFSLFLLLTLCFKNFFICCGFFFKLLGMKSFFVSLHC